MNLFLQTLINGVLLGGFYALISLGFHLIHTTNGIINLAHGEFILLGAYLSWFFDKELGVEPFVSAFLLMPVLFAVGYLLHARLLHRFLGRSGVIAVLSTLGLSLILTNIFELVFTNDPRTTNSSLAGYWQLGEITLPRVQTVVGVITVVLIGALLCFLLYTRTGKSVRAVAQNPDAAWMMGMEVSRIYSIVFALGIALSSIAGSLMSPMHTITPFAGQWLLLKAITISVMAWRSGWSVLLGSAVLLGLIEMFAATYVRGIGTNLSTAISLVIPLALFVMRSRRPFDALVRSSGVTS